MMSAFEMNQNLDFLEEELRSVPEYVAAFKEVFGGAITRERVAMALAAFERELVSLNSPLDRYLNGDEDALSPEAKRGLAIFRGKGDCTRCHFGDYLSDQKFHALNVPENLDYAEDPRVAATRRFVAKVYHYDDYMNLEEDPGRYLITKDKADWKAFRTPTLRNISDTAPYMHNGFFITLDEVIEFYNRGGGLGNTELKPMGLTEGEKKDLKAFLVEALKGEELDITYPEVP
jgi:cytochrome c peroxidase